MLQSYQTEAYALLAHVYEIQIQGRAENYVSIWADSQAALEALQADKTPSPLVQYNTTKIRWMTSLSITPWGCTGSLDMPEYVEMKSPTSW